MSVQIKGSGTIGGIDEGLNITGVITATNFKTGVSNLNSTGLTLTGGQLDIGSNIKLGSAGVVTATSFVGSGANLTGISGVSIANQSDNRLISCTGSTDALNAEQYLTYSSQSSLNLTDGNGTSYLGGNYLNLKRSTGNTNYINAPLANAELVISADEDIIFRTVHTADFNSTERFRITDAGVFQSTGSTLMKQHSVGIGTTNTAGRNAGVSTARGEIVYNTSTESIEYYRSNALGWATVKRQVENDGSSQNFAARSAKALLDDGITNDGVYWLNMHGAYSSGNAKRHYCLMDSSYDGGGWTLLWCMNHGNNFASGHNFSYALNVGSNPTSVNDFTASNFGYDRRNTFTPQANDQFLIRRSDNNDWRRFVVTTWSPTHNSISDGWSCTQSTDGVNRNHPYYAYGQMYDTSGNAVSGMVHFNGCAVGGNCATGGGDSDGFGDHINWSSGYSPYNCWGGAFNGQGNGGSPLYWGQTALSQGGSLYLQMFYRRTGTQ
tara:strand:+ start:373 stop:1854 length:1482 start_codon:yes stop_codon:yes gene_type:complete